MTWRFCWKVILGPLWVTWRFRWKDILLKGHFAERSIRAPCEWRDVFAERSFCWKVNRGPLWVTWCLCWKVKGNLGPPVYEERHTDNSWTGHCPMIHWPGPSCTKHCFSSSFSYNQINKISPLTACLYEKIIFFRISADFKLQERGSSFPQDKIKEFFCGKIVPRLWRSWLCNGVPGAGPEFVWLHYHTQKLLFKHLASLR